MEILTLDYVKDQNFNAIDMVKFFNPNWSTEDCDFYLWEMTCYPFSTEILIEQLNQHFVKNSINNIKTKKMNIAKATKVLTDAIKKDKELKYGYKANIAMAFKDEYARKSREKNHLNKEDIHEIANQAADNFLDQWCK